MEGLLSTGRLVFKGFNNYLVLKKKGFWVLSWSTRLLSIVGELEGGGVVAVAVGIGDR